MDKNTTVSESTFIGEWDWKKNNKLSLDPNKITLGSKVEAYWRCSLQNHSYRMKIYNKKAGKNCSYCYGNKVLPGFNDLLTKFPENALYWDDKNALKAHEVYFNSNQKHHFKCHKCGLEWEQELKRFNNSKHKCKGCFKFKRNNTTHSKNIDEISKIFSLNNSVNFGEINVKDCKSKYLWNCALNHEWSATPYNIFNGRGCPYCTYKKVLKGFNDLDSQEPEVAKYFDEEANGVKASEVSHKSTGKSYRWFNSDCGHSWSSKVYIQVAKNYCKICARGERAVVKNINDIFTIYPKLKELFIHELNEAYLTYHKKSNKTIKIYCEAKLHITEVMLLNYNGGKIKCEECLKTQSLSNDQLNKNKKEKYLKRLEDNKLINFFPDSMLEWSNFNGNINNFTVGSKKTALFNCEKCGGFYITDIKNKFRRDREFNCKICNGKKVQYGINDLENYLIRENLSIIINEYAHCNEKDSKEIFYKAKYRVTWCCSKCKKFYERSPYERLIENKNCSNCSKSFGELELLSFIESIYSGEIYGAVHSLIWPYEIDIYLPELQLAIEYNGNYWHNGEQLMKRVNMSAYEYHSLKLNKCRERNVQLLYIWEHDWVNNKEYMKLLIKEFMNGSIVHGDLQKLTHDVEG